MKINGLNKTNKLFLTIDDVSSILSINKDSAKVSANRYVKNNLLIRLKNNLYITPEKFERLKEIDLFKLANLIQVPSYISFTTALSFYNITTQQLQGVIESAAVKRTKQVIAKNIQFNYIILKKDFYNNFISENDFFIATPEKALADIIYLSSMNRYKCDFEAVDFKKIDNEIVSELLKNSNIKAQKFWESLCKRYKI